MKYLFSAEQNAFYPFILKDDYLNAGTWPADGIGVDESLFLEFIAEPPEGKVRGFGKNGLPAWADVPPPAQWELQKTAEAEKRIRITAENDFIDRRQWPGKAALRRLAPDENAG